MEMLRKHIAILFSLYFLSFGCGINMFDYCCNACADFGSNNYLFVDCESVHESHECESQHACGTTSCNHDHDLYMTFEELCDHLRNSDPHCSLHRLELPTTKLLTQQMIHVEQPILFELRLPIDLMPIAVVDVPHFVDSSPPLNWHGRELLSHISTLLI